MSFLCFGKQGWDTPPRFQFGERLKNKFGRILTIVDCKYEVGEYCIPDCWVYRVKFDDGEYGTLWQKRMDDYEILISS